MNAQYLESSHQLDRFFPDSLHKIKFHIFQNISNCFIHGYNHLNIGTRVGYLITYKTKTRE